MVMKKARDEIRKKEEKCSEWTFKGINYIISQPASLNSKLPEILSL